MWVGKEDKLQQKISNCVKMRQTTLNGIFRLVVLANRRRLVLIMSLIGIAVALFFNSNGQKMAFVTTKLTQKSWSKWVKM